MKRGDDPDDIINGLRAWVAYSAHTGSIQSHVRSRVPEPAEMGDTTTTDPHRSRTARQHRHGQRSRNSDTEPDDIFNLDSPSSRGIGSAS